MRRNRLALLIAAFFVIFVIVIPLFSVGIGLLVDWTWFSHIGFREIFVTIVGTQFRLGIGCGAVFLLLAGLNLWAARGVAHRSGYLATARPSARIAEFPAIEKFPAVFRSLLWFAVVLVAFPVGQWAATHWGSYLLATHAARMTETDPILGISLSFYLFRLPFLFFVYHLALIVLLVSLVTAALWYLIEGGAWISPRGLGMGRNARRHLMVLGGLLFLMLAWRARLGMYDLVYSPGGLVFGAGYTDIHVSWPVLWIQLVLCVVAAIAFLAGARDGRMRPAQYAVGGVLAVALVGGLIAPTLVQWWLVAPSELEKEQPYIARNIKFTRQAYGLDRFDEHDFPAIQDLTAASIQQNATTMRNLRLPGWKWHGQDGRSGIAAGAGRHDAAGNRGGIGQIHRGAGSGEEGRGRGTAQPRAATKAGAGNGRRCSAQEYSDDRSDRRWQNGNCAAPGAAGRMPFREGGSLQVHGSGLRGARRRIDGARPGGNLHRHGPRGKAG